MGAVKIIDVKNKFIFVTFERKLSNPIWKNTIFEFNVTSESRLFRHYLVLYLSDTKFVFTVGQSAKTNVRYTGFLNLHIQRVVTGKSECKCQSLNV